MDEHWTIRRWNATELVESTAVRITWHTRGNGVGDGTSGGLHLNGVQADFATVPGTDATGVTRIYYANLDPEDVVDLVLTPEGATSRVDGSDTSFNWMLIDTIIPDVALQPNGSLFIPINSPDTDEDGLADLWEELFFPGDLTKLKTGGDADNDGLLDEQELAAGTNPARADSDGDGLLDGAELAAGTNPARADSDGDCYSDFHEVATGFDPRDPFSNPLDSFTAIADSGFDFPLTDNPQGERGWTYGFYNTTQDGEPPVNSNFIQFPTDGSSILSATNFWDGLKFDWFNDPPNGAGDAHNPPWTEIGQYAGHPNGDNNVDVHWVVRRWEVDADAQLALHYFVKKTNPNGNGVSAIILHNGQPLDSITIAGDDTEGKKSWSFVDAKAGDRVEVALSPRGIDGGDGDGADASEYWLLVDPTIPANPLQPDGSPWVPGGGGGPSRLLAFEYNGDVTLKWTSKDNKEYQVQVSSDLRNWNNLGPTVPAAAGGETEATIQGAPAPPSYYRVLELDP